MPRTIDSIVANHNAASALRAAGEPIWKYHVDIKEILADDDSSVDPVVISSKANRIALALKAHLPARMLDCNDDECDLDFIDTFESMRDCNVAELAEDLKNGVPAVEMLNGWLDTLYDWANTNRVWLGR